jgi:taurine dioxygenase
MLISNIRKDGKPIGALPDGEMHFHTDQCRRRRPPRPMLYAIESRARVATRCSQCLHGL